MTSLGVIRRRTDDVDTVFRGLDGGDGGGFGWSFFLVLLHHAFQQEADGAFALFGFGDFGPWGQDA